MISAPERLPQRPLSAATQPSAPTRRPAPMTNPDGTSTTARVPSRIRPACAALRPNPVSAPKQHGSPRPHVAGRLGPWGRACHCRSSRSMRVWIASPRARVGLGQSRYARPRGKTRRTLTKPVSPSRSKRTRQSPTRRRHSSVFASLTTSPAGGSSVSRSRAVMMRRWIGLSRRLKSRPARAEKLQPLLALKRPRA